jgi:hypothetical protein
MHECELFKEVPGVFAYQQVAFLPFSVVSIGFVCSCWPVALNTWEQLTQAAFLCSWASRMICCRLLGHLQMALRMLYEGR